MRLENKVAIVTGAAMGIGWGIAKIFLQEGAKVVAADKDDETGWKAVQGFKHDIPGADALFVHCDVTREDEIVATVNKAVEVYGKIDILVNNAGAGFYQTVLQATGADFDRAIATNLKSAFLFAKYSIPYMEKQGSGVIINISSVHSFAAVNGVVPYAITKGGLTAMTRNLAIDHGPAIRVNSIAPGWVLTPNVQRIFDGYEDPAEQRRSVEQRQVMKRIGTPEDIGQAAAFLASDEASFITGTQLYVDGGLTAQLETW